MKHLRRRVVVLLLLAPAVLRAQQDSRPATPSYGEAAAEIRARLDESVAELARFRERTAEEKIPLERRIRELESALTAARQEHQAAVRKVDGRSLDLTNLREELKKREEEAAYVSNLLAEYASGYDARLHVAELARAKPALEAARLAGENRELGPEEVAARRLGLVEASIARLEEALGGARFDGEAVDAGGIVRSGTFLMLGPAALFRSRDGAVVGAAEQRLGSLEPTVVPFSDPQDAAEAASLVATGDGAFPLDATLGAAHKTEAVKETLAEHVMKGGPIMWPIFAMAGAATLVVLWKWLSMAAIRRPSRRRLEDLLEAVRSGDRAAAVAAARRIGGPTGRMLVVGAEHLDEPRGLVEEVMYERVLTTKLKLNAFLPFVAIAASSAPLLGLLGTVTGIMNTFQLITVFGTGDVKTLSSGISEALITTEYGLIVAIPALLLHALLSRKAKGILDGMESAALALLNAEGRRRAVAGVDVSATTSTTATAAEGAVASSTAFAAA